MNEEIKEKLARQARRQERLMQYRHECEVRYLREKRAQKGGTSWVANFLALVEKKRGKESRDKLNSDFVTQWSRGNIGIKDVWYEEKKEDQSKLF